MQSVNFYRKLILNGGISDIQTQIWYGDNLVNMHLRLKIRPTNI